MAKKTEGFAPVRKVLANALLLALGAALFALSHPNFFFEDGIGALGFVFLVPVFLLVDRCCLASAPIYGFFYGALSYTAACYWLSAFHPGAIFIAQIGGGLILAFVFFILKLICRSYGAIRFFLMGAAWCAYEYLKTLGFLGLGYGVCAYSQWRFLPLACASSLFGVWGISLLLAEFSALCATAMLRALGRRRLLAAGISWLLALSAMLAYGTFFYLKDYSGFPQIPVAALQNNTSPWGGGIAKFERDVEFLCAMTDSALRKRPETKIVVWPETSFVPPVLHYRGNFAEDFRRAALVARLESFARNRDAILVLGNDHAEFSGGERKDYNAALVLERGESDEIKFGVYKKQHLVPFTEHFPWERHFPRFSRFLLNGDERFWSAGSEPRVFGTEAADFSTPICFEDTFGSLCAEMVSGGARLLLNLTNDAWGKSLPCQKQHFAMARFRAMECRVPLVISSVSGQSAAVLPNGRILSEIAPFAPGIVLADVPDLRGAYNPTPYVRFGDVLGVILALFTAALVLLGLFRMAYARESK